MQLRRRPPAEVLGFVYEAAVGAGIVAACGEVGELAYVGPWDPRRHLASDDLAALDRCLDWRPAAWESQRAAVARCGHLHGQTIARRWIEAHAGVRPLRVLLPATAIRGADVARAELAAALDVSADALPRGIYEAGGVGNTDLAVVGVVGDDLALLVVECGLGLGVAPDGGVPLLLDHERWRELIERAAAQRLRIGGFASPNAAVDGPVSVAFPPALRRLYRAIMRRTTVSKLFQGCAYARPLGELLSVTRGARVLATVVATSMLGFEHLSAECSPPGAPPSATWTVLSSCADLYPGHRETGGDTGAEEGRLFDIRAELRAHVGTAGEALAPDALTEAGVLDLRAAEELTGFVRTHGALPDGRSFRDAHASAVQEAIVRAPRGEVTVVALIGAPGIGKTTAIREALQGRRPKRGDAPGTPVHPAVVEGGWCYVYASPRISINADQFHELSAPADGRATCCLTANAALAQAVTGRAERPEGFAYLRGESAGLAVNRTADGDDLLDRTVLFTHECAETLERGAEAATDRRFTRLATNRVVTRRVRRTPVLEGLAVAGRAVAKAMPALDRLVLAVSLQALSQGRVEGLNALLSAAAQPGVAEVAAFARRFRTVVVMLDEFTGEEGSPELVRKVRDWLERTFVERLRGTDAAPKVVLFLSDASLANAASLTGHLAHPKAPPRVLVSAVGEAPAGVRVDREVVRLGPRPRDLLACTTVHGNAYPAERLIIGYRLVLTSVAPEREVRELARSLTQRRAELLEQQMTAILRDELTRPGGQVLCFVQSKPQLEALARALVKSGLLREEDVLCVSANMGPREHEILSTPARRDALRLVLMTSSGTRGISFPRADRLIAFLQPFAAEQHLMELVQFAWRGRGGDGDRLDRRVEIVVLDTMVESDDPLDQERRHADLLAMALTARAALHTRVFGHLARPGRAPIAVVPVGRSGSRTRGAHLQQMLNEFVVTSARWNKLPVVVELTAACRAMLDRARYRPRDGRIPSFHFDPERCWAGSVDPLPRDDDVRACGPLLLAPRRFWDNVSFADEETRRLEGALRTFFGVKDERRWPNDLVRAARAIDRLWRTACTSQGQQDLIGMAFDATLVVPIARDDIGNSLLAVPEGAEADDAHAAWGDALEGWVNLMSGSVRSDVGGRTRRYQRFPFLVLSEDVDPTGLDDLGRRAIARAGLLCNALAGIVMGPAGPGPGSTA